MALRNSGKATLSDCLQPQRAFDWVSRCPSFRVPLTDFLACGVGGVALGFSSE